MVQTPTLGFRALFSRYITGYYTTEASDVQKPRPSRRASVLYVRNAKRGPDALVDGYERVKARPAGRRRDSGHDMNSNTLCRTA